MSLAAFWQERLDYNKTLAVNYETAIATLSTDGIESYTLDTGQGRQQVTRRDLTGLQSDLDIIYNRIATLDARVNGTGVGNFRRV